MRALGRTNKIPGFAKRWFPKGWFWRMFPGTKNRNEGTFRCSPAPRTGTKVHSDVPRDQTRNEGTFAETAILRSCPFVSSRKIALIACFKILNVSSAFRNPRSSFPCFLRLSLLFFLLPFSASLPCFPRILGLSRRGSLPFSCLLCTWPTEKARE